MGVDGVELERKRWGGREGKKGRREESGKNGEVRKREEKGKNEGKRGEGKDNYKGG